MNPRSSSLPIGSRLAALLLAALVTLGFLGILSQSRTSRSRLNPLAGNELVMMTVPPPALQSLASVREATPAARSSVPRTASARDRKRPGDSPPATHAFPAVPVVPPAREALTAVLPVIDRGVPAPAPASAPLVLDGKTIRQAERASRSAVRQMAMDAGQEIDAPVMSKDEKLAAAIANAAIPRCGSSEALKFTPPKIGPVGMGGLLSLPFYVQAAVTGKCRLD